MNDRLKALVAWLVGCAVVISFMALVVAILIYMGGQ